MKIGIGLDFGNSNSTLALYDGKDITYIPLDGDKSVMPSALYLSREYVPTVGSKALSTYLDDNRGRRIQLKKKNIGIIQVHMGEMDRDHFEERERTITTDIHAYVDANQPGRLFASLKGYLGMKGEQRFQVFEKNFRLEALLTLIFNYIQECTEHQIHEATSFTVGRPVVYAGDHEDSNTTAIERMNYAWSNVREGKQEYVYEPLGAAASYFHTNKVKEGERVFVFDFGGGTLDLCVLQMDQDKPRVLGSAGLPKAGDYIDHELFKTIVFPHIGQGLELRLSKGSDKMYPFPFGEYTDNILNWQSTHLLTLPKYMEPINEGAMTTPEAVEPLTRLTKLIRNNGSFSLLKRIEQAKVALSKQDSVQLEMEEIDLNITLTKEDFKKILEPLSNEIQTLIVDFLKDVNVRADQIDRVVCTGGSSQIPMIQDLLDSNFPGKIESYSPFNSIASGLAIMDYNRKSS
ncbi:Hsp70 family protein [Spirochaeta cellobiosiphila]|uniref:Hsp70 family protein n=1 Tax=Spirochaeta cellobiosiphila TaxID=504483 RepID=UPI0003F65F4E|nr:Hsp70 family protein [Spirochaeta cellobiosiphila]